MKTDAPETKSPAGPDGSIDRKIAFIQSSLRCFVLSLVGLIPVLGIPCAVAAIIRSSVLARAAGKDWNPATRYLNAAGRIGLLGLLSTTAFLTVICLFILASDGNSWRCSWGVG